MKTLILSAAAALALAAPAIAAPIDLANDIFAQSYSEGDGARGTVDFPAGGATDVAVATFAQSYSEGDGARITAGDVSTVILSSSNSDLIAFATAKLDNDLRGDN